MLLALFLGHGVSAQTYSTFGQAERLANALAQAETANPQDQFEGADTLVFQLLASTYQAQQQPISVHKIYRDVRENPFLTAAIEPSYKRLIVYLAHNSGYTNPNSALASMQEYQQRVNERHQLLRTLRVALAKLVLRADSTEGGGLDTLRWLHRTFYADSLLPAAQWLLPNVRAGRRTALLLDVMTRFVNVANTRRRMTVAEEVAMRLLFPGAMNQLTDLDAVLLPTALSFIDNLPHNPQLISEFRFAATAQSLDVRRNPFTRRAATSLQPQSTAQGATTGSSSLEAAALDGLARFVAKRFKDELQAAFFERFNSLLHDSSYLELRTLFPNTTRLVTRGSVDYSTIIQLLRNTFEQDLQNLFFSANELLGQPRYRRLFVAAAGATDTERDLARALRYTHVALVVLAELQRGTHPHQVLARLRTEVSRMPGVPAEVQQTAQVLQVLSEAFLAEGSLSQAWVRAADVEAMLANIEQRPQLTCFLGLLYQRLLRLEIALPLLADADRLHQAAFGFARLATDLQAHVDSLRTHVRTLNHAHHPQPEAYVRLYQLGLETVSFASEHILARPLPEVKRAEAISSTIMDGYQAALRGEYGVTVTNLLKITDELLPQQLHNRSQLLRYAPFMAAVAQARTPEQMEQAISAVALPAGSSAIKRRTFTSISLNAFAGPTNGAEWLYQGKLNPLQLDGEQLRYNVGFTAPIGLAFTRAVRGNALAPRLWHKRSVQQRSAQGYHYLNQRGKEHYLKGRAIGIFLAVLDLGALVQYRLNDATNNSPLPAKVSLRQVFAPGVFVQYHLGRSPLTAFVGAQISPKLRIIADTTVPAATTPIPNANAFRLNAGLVVDIPLVHLLARSETRQGNAPLQEVYKQRERALRRAVDYYDRPRKNRRYPETLNQVMEAHTRSIQLLRNLNTP